MACRVDGFLAAAASMAFGWGRGSARRTSHRSGDDGALARPPDASLWVGRIPRRPPMRPRRGPGIPASDLLPLAAVASELTPGRRRTRAGGGAGCGHADPAVAGWLGSLALSKAKRENSRLRVGQAARQPKESKNHTSATT